MGKIMSVRDHKLYYLRVIKLLDKEQKIDFLNNAIATCSETIKWINGAGKIYLNGARAVRIREEKNKIEALKRIRSEVEFGDDQ